MDKQTAIDRLLETENLTDGLEDDDAGWLLDWGIRSVADLAPKPGGEIPGTKVNELMALMREISRILAGRESAASGDLARAITGLAGAYARAFGRARRLSPDEAAGLAAGLPHQPTRQALQALIGAIRPGGDAGNA